MAHSFSNNKRYFCSDCLDYQLQIQNLNKEMRLLKRKLRLQEEYGKRPPILKEVIHHSARSPDSQCLYGSSAWDQYVYE